MSLMNKICRDFALFWTLRTGTKPKARPARPSKNYRFLLALIALCAAGWGSLAVYLILNSGATK